VTGGFLESPSDTDHKQIYFALKHMVKEKCNLRHTNWEGYKDLETILKKASSKFHILDKKDLEAAAQYTSDAIIVAFEANCPLKPKNTSNRVLW